MNETPNNDIPTRRDRASLGWFGLGVLVGAVAAIGILMLTGLTSPSAPGTTDLNTIRDAAREGAKDALLNANTGVTMPLSLNDIRDAAKQGAAEALTNSNQDNAAQAAEPTAAAVDTSSIQLRPSNTQGNANATVTLIEYSDFQCPYCKHFHDTILTNIITDYVKTGKVKFSFKNYAFLGDESRWAAQAAECAADQGKFWEMHELLFTHQQGENTGTFTKENLINLAKEIKVDNSTFATCLNQDKTLDRVQADITEGNQVGVRGTPSFLLNGKLIVGAQPYATFKAAIDAALQQ
jgi:protein-disulfide isomerase